MTIKSIKFDLATFSDEELLQVEEDVLAELENRKKIKLQEIVDNLNCAFRAIDELGCSAGFEDPDGFTYVHSARVGGSGDFVYLQQL